MKRYIVLLVVLLVGIPMLVLAGDNAQSDQAKWDAFSKNLVNAITSENEGLRRSAMQLIIEHADKLDLNDAIFELVTIYRYHENEKVRQMAAVAIQKLDSNWARGFLKRNLKFEDSEIIKHQIMAGLAAE